jgi:hypothetical protein
MSCHLDGRILMPPKNAAPERQFLVYPGPSRIYPRSNDLDQISTNHVRYPAISIFDLTNYSHKTLKISK